MLIRDKIKTAVGKHYKLDKELSRKEIIDCVCSEYPGTNRSSVMPSDYCSNISNKDRSSGVHHFFEYVKRNIYRVLIS